MTSPYTPEGPDDKKSSGEELKEALLKSADVPLPEEKGPVGPFEHSGETAGWTEVEEKVEKSGEAGLAGTAIRPQE